MLLYHYEDEKRTITESGYWFKRGGIYRNDTPSWMAPMVFMPNWDINYVCVCDNLKDVLTYFPPDLHDRIGGVVRIYSYPDTAPLKPQSDAIMTYLTADSNQMMYLETLRYENAWERLK